MQNVGGNNISVGLLNPLAVKSGMVNTLNGTYDFDTDDNTEINESLTSGTKVLFVEDDDDDL